MLIAGLRSMSLYATMGCRLPKRAIAPETNVPQALWLGVDLASAVRADSTHVPETHVASLLWPIAPAQQTPRR